MVISNIEQGGSFSSELANQILTNEAVQETLINNILTTMRQKNYYGLDIDFEYIFPRDRENYNNFLRKIGPRLKAQGYSLTTALAPKISATQQGILYEAHDYPVHGAFVDHVILMTYEWGFTYSPPRAVAPLNEVRKVLNYAVSAIRGRKSSWASLITATIGRCLTGRVPQQPPFPTKGLCSWLCVKAPPSSLIT
jgi:spore germination protein